MTSPENHGQLFDTKDLEIFVPAVHRAKPEAPPEPQEEALFDLANVESDDSPQTVEAVDELPEPIDLDKYDPLEGIEGISSTQKARIETRMRVNGDSIENAVISVFGDAAGKELLAKAGLIEQAKHANRVHKSGGDRSSVNMRPTSGRRRSSNNVMIGDVGAAKSRGLEEALKDSKRAENTENPPQ